MGMFGFAKHWKSKNYKFGDVIVCVHVSFKLSQPCLYFPLILYQSLILPHVALGFLGLSIYLSLSVLLSYPLSVDLLFVCERENETMI